MVRGIKNRLRERSRFWLDLVKRGWKAYRTPIELAGGVVVVGLALWRFSQGEAGWTVALLLLAPLLLLEAGALSLWREQRPVGTLADQLAALVSEGEQFVARAAPGTPWSAEQAIDAFAAWATKVFDALRESTHAHFDAWFREAVGVLPGMAFAQPGVAKEGTVRRAERSLECLRKLEALERLEPKDYRQNGPLLAESAFRAQYHEGTTFVAQVPIEATAIEAYRNRVEAWIALQEHLAQIALLEPVKERVLEDGFLKPEQLGQSQFLSEARWRVLQERQHRAMELVRDFDAGQVRPDFDPNQVGLP